MRSAVSRESIATLRNARETPPPGYTSRGSVHVEFPRHPSSRRFFFSPRDSHTCRIDSRGTRESHRLLGNARAVAAVETAGHVIADRVTRLFDIPAGIYSVAQSLILAPGSAAAPRDEGGETWRESVGGAVAEVEETLGGVACPIAFPVA